MKIALLLCGQLRSVEMVKYMIKHSIIDNSENECDVFMGVDLCNSKQNAYLNIEEESSLNELNNVIDFLEPTYVYKLDEDIFRDEWYNFKFKEELKFPAGWPECCDHIPVSHEILNKNDDNKYTVNKLFDSTNIILSQDHIFSKDWLEIIFRQFHLVDNLYHQIDERYDIVIKLRFDQFIYNAGCKLFFDCERNEAGQIRFSKHNLNLFKTLTPSEKLKLPTVCGNSIHVFGTGVISSYVYTNDQFWIHSRDVTARMKRFYKQLPEIINTSNREHPIYNGGNIEHWFTRFLTSEGIDIYQLSEIYGEFIRTLHQ